MHLISTAALALYASLLVFGTHWPRLPARPEWMVVPAGFAMGPDKVAHFVAFAMLAMLAAIWIRVRRGQLGWRQYAIVAGVLAAYAPLDEITQALVPPRTPDVYDFVANLAGITAGLTAFYMLGLCGSALRPKPSVWR